MPLRGNVFSYMLLTIPLARLSLEHQLNSSRDSPLLMLNISAVESCSKELHCAILKRNRPSRQLIPGSQGVPGLVVDKKAYCDFLNPISKLGVSVLQFNRDVAPHGSSEKKTLCLSSVDVDHDVHRHPTPLPGDRISRTQGDQRALRWA